jgi:type II secretory pathway pseudopilin PulG
MSLAAKRRIGDWIVVVAVALVGIALTLTFVRAEQQSDAMAEQSEQIDALYGALEAEQEAAVNNGETPVAPAPDELIDDPDAERPAPVGPSDEQVLAAVQAYFRENPVQDGEDASPAAIAAAVINYLTENPPVPGEPGPAPTADQISNAVASHLAANPPPAGPPGTNGTNGVDGEDGHTPTSAEIQAELDAYLDAHPIEMCDPGWEAGVLTVLTTGPPTEITTCVRQEEN